MNLMIAILILADQLRGTCWMLRVLEEAIIDKHTSSQVILWPILKINNKLCYDVFICFFTA